MPRNKSETLQLIPDRAPCYEDDDCEDVYAHQSRTSNYWGKLGLIYEGKHGPFMRVWDFGKFDDRDWETLNWPSGNLWIARGYYILTHEFDQGDAWLAPANHLGQPLWAGLEGTALEDQELPGYDAFRNGYEAVKHFCDAELSELDLRLLKNSHATQ